MKKDLNTKFKIRLKKNDLVVVRTGKYKGKTGKVLATYPKTNQVLVEGVNIVKKHLKPNKAHPSGGIIDITKPINVSKVGLYDSTLKKAVRIRYKLIVAADNSVQKVRLNAKTGKEIDN